jgi:hypothetical protein
VNINKEKKEKLQFTSKEITLSSSLTFYISVLTLGILLFIFVPKEVLSISNILSMNIFYT